MSAMADKAVVVRLASRPEGAPSAANFEVASAPMPAPGPDEALVQALYLSLDPALRPRMNAVSDYAGAVPLGAVVPGPALGVVIASQSPLLKAGDYVTGFLGWQSHAAMPAAELRKIDPAHAPLPKWLSLLGLSSFTAWIGLTEIGKPQPGETVVVSAASGATGSVVGQIARIMGARAVGIAGGPAKCRYVVEQLGFDACVDYRGPGFLAQLDAACPRGVDVDFENVGGDVLRAVFARMNPFGRVVVCGLVSEYSAAGFRDGPSLWPTVYKALRIEGFRASRYFDRIPAFVDQALAWSAEGRLKHREHITEGIENTPQAFVDMLAGVHVGKAMVKV
jgi:NADPH-dependent curcumin reductase CurA